jgi:hypothetical protein
MINQTTEGGTDVIDVLEDFFKGKINAQVPDLEKVPYQGGAKINSWIFFVASGRAGLGDVIVWGAEVNCGEWRGTVNDQSSFSFS